MLPSAVVFLLSWTVGDECGVAHADVSNKPWVCGPCCNSQPPNSTSHSAVNTDAIMSQYLSQHTRPNVNMLQGTYIWMYVEHGERGCQWKGRRRETQGEQSGGQNCNMT